MAFGAQISLTNAAVNCCEYAYFLSVIQPHPSEVVDITGVVTDQYGSGEPGVQVQYHDNLANDKNYTTDSRGVFILSFTTPNFPASSTVSYTITMKDAVTTWGVTVTDSYSINAVSGDIPVLYSSEMTGGRGSYVKVSSPNLPAIIYIGGGYELDFLHGLNQLDPGTTSFLDFMRTAGFNVVAPVGWFSPDLPAFPLVIGALLKYGFLINHVYLIGWSAGGVAAAWALTNDFNRIFDQGVIMDAELTGPSETATRTPYSVFTTAQFSGQVSIPHLLVWGKDDSGSISIQGAGEWLRHAKEGFVRIDAFPYSHTWIGTATEFPIRSDLVAFFKNGLASKGIVMNVGNNVTDSPVKVVTNSELANLTYSADAKVFSMTVTGESGTIGVINMIIPKALLNGEPIVIIDSVSLTPAYSEDSKDYYVFFSYTHSSHTVLVGGKNSIPEFPSNITQLIVFMLLVACFASASRKTSIPHIPVKI